VVPAPLMQTFLPYPDFADSARSLDDRRLGKQRVECLQILRALTYETYGWRNHPAVLMWAGYEEALVSYALEVCAEWGRRGFADTVRETIGRDATSAALGTIRSQAELAGAGALPPWLGRDELHRSHRSALLRKMPEWYGSRFDDVPDVLPYHWPVRSADLRR
jgi:hypothetical protein